MNKNCKYLKKKINHEIWCTYNKERVFKNMCAKCDVKDKYFIDQKSTLNKNKKHKLTNATDIPTSIKKKVWKRDKGKCIFCHTSVEWNYANSHYIKRSQLGLGIEENIFTACLKCHNKFDDSIYRKSMLLIAKNHLINLYPNWNENMLIYKKYR